MYARTESPHDQCRVAFDRRDLATPPGLDCREGKTKTCVNQFQSFFLSELVLHHRWHPPAPSSPRSGCGRSLGVHKSPTGIDGEALRSQPGLSEATRKLKFFLALWRWEKTKPMRTY